uniref:TIR domain-containing protein n=1 Tax=Kalanchoe fedtschenkoi TaxID=63787 RepID=A0A7N0SWV8_KALFE
MAGRFGAGCSQYTREKFAYQVFLSFRGEDVRKRFIDHLHHALKRAAISTFHDDTGLERGSDIQSKLYDAIERSKLSIVTFSSGYASSRWCLDELVKIMQCRSSSSLGHLVLPVFYDVDPTAVRHQSGPYKDAFDKHVANSKLASLRVESWRVAMRAVADLAGFVLENQADGHEAQFIQNIITEVMKRLDKGHLSVPRCIIGANSIVETISEWVQNGSSGVEVGLIYGLGGVGKTTVAKVVYNWSHDKFDGCSFLADVKRVSSQHNGIIQLQKQIISNLSGIQASHEIYNVHEGMLKVREVIGSRRILLVLDGCDEWEEICSIFDHPEWFAPGSKLLITSRSKQLPVICMSKKEFRVCELSCADSTELFCWNAFGQCHPLENYEEITGRFVEYCGGLPLALEVLSLSLRGKGLVIWESQLAKLEDFPSKRIQDILRLSFESIEDDNDKDIFLHIAFFMVGMHVDYAFTILEGCGLHTKIGYQNLVDRCLVTTIYDGRIMMHQLIQEMGREVVRQEAYNQPGRRSRLWGHKETYNVLRTKKGTSAVKGLRLQLQLPVPNVLMSSENHHNERTSKRRRCIDPTSELRSLRTDAFTNMENLNLLELNYVPLEGNYADFPKAIKWLCWRGFHLESIPEDLDLYELVVLDMQNSCLVRAWEGCKDLGALRILNLSHSHRLLYTPDLSWATGIEAISLEDCTGLIEVHESLGSLSRLTYLNLKGCKNLKKFPRDIQRLSSLETLDLSDCSGLFTDSNQMDTSMILGSRSYAITTNALNSPEPLSRIRAPGSPAISFNSFPFLVTLTLTNCGICRDDLFSYLNCSSSLEYLDLSGNPITVIDKSLSHFTRLYKIILRDCTNLRSVSVLPRTCSVSVTGCLSLEKMAYLQSPFPSKELADIEADDCPKLVEIGGLCNLETTSDMSASRAKYLGYPNLESFGEKDVSIDLYAPRRLLKGVYQSGLYSVFLLGDHIDKWFTTVTYGSELTYTVPSLPNRSIRAFNVCYVYKCITEPLVASANLCMKNEGSKWEWSYFSARYFMYNNEEEDLVRREVDLTWISHWCVMEHRELRPG